MVVEHNEARAESGAQASSTVSHSDAVDVQRAAHLRRRVATLSRVCGIVTSAIGALVLAGWIFRVEALKGLVPGMIIVLPTTAVGFVLAGIGVALQPSLAAARSGRTGRSAVLAAILVTALGLMASIERLGQIDLGIDRRLFITSVERYSYRPAGRMATNSAIAFTLAGCALLSAAFGRLRRTGRVFAASGLAIAMLALIGYLYGAQQLYTFDAAAGMAFLTAAAFAFLFVGLLLGSADGTSTSLLVDTDLGAKLARRLLPWILLVPLLLGRIWIAARNAHVVSREGAAALFVMVTMCIIGILVVRSAIELRATDLKRQAALANEAIGRARAEELRQSAEIANEVKNYFLATMSHELRTPLNAITGYTQLIGMGVHGPVTDDQARDLDRIAANAKSLSVIIGDILAFEKLESSEEHVALQPVSLNDILTGVGLIFDSRVVARGIYLEIHACDPKLIVQADPDRLQQILVNLVSNSLKFTPDGGKVAVRSDLGPSGLSIRVEDTGIGIAPTDLDRIFAPFVQLDRTLTGPSRGVGLGLAISRDLARRMNADLRVQSSLGKGSVFELTFPASRPVAADPPRRDHSRTAWRA